MDRKRIFYIGVLILVVITIVLVTYIYYFGCWDDFCFTIALFTLLLFYLIFLGAMIAAFIHDCRSTNLEYIREHQKQELIKRRRRLREERQRNGTSDVNANSENPPIRRQPGLSTNLLVDSTVAIHSGIHDLPIGQPSHRSSPSQFSNACIRCMHCCCDYLTEYEKYTREQQKQELIKRKRRLREERQRNATDDNANNQNPLIRRPPVGLSTNILLDGTVVIANIHDVPNIPRTAPNSQQVRLIPSSAIPNVPSSSEISSEALWHPYAPATSSLDGAQRMPTPTAFSSLSPTTNPNPLFVNLDLPPSYEQVIKEDPNALPTYEQATGIHSRR